jgi:hypothetical protein
MAELVRPTAEAVLHVASRLRESDAREIFACRWWDAGAEELAADVMAVPGMAWVVLANDGEPVAVIGARPAWPGVWTVFAFGTPRWSEVVRTMTKHVRRFMIPALRAAGARIAMCYADRAHHASCRWLSAMGARAEALHEGWGREGEDFIMFAWRA